MLTSSPTGSLDFFHHLLDAAGVGISLLDADGAFLLVNSRYCELYGFSADELIGRHFSMIVSDDAVAGLLARHVQVMEQGAELTFPARLKRKDGTVFDSLVTARRISWDGRFYRVNTVTDVTAAKVIERDLLHKEIRLRSILANAVDGIVTIDDKGIIESVNPAFRKIFGYAEDRLLGRNVKMLMPEPLRSQHDGFLERYETGGERLAVGHGREVQGERSDGTVFPMDIAVSEMFLDDRRYFIGIVRDITERKRAEDAVRQREMHLRAILENAVDGIITIDESGRIESVNPAAEVIFGYDKGDLLGKNVNILMPSPDHERHDGYIRRYLDNAHANIIGYGREVQGLRKDGTVFPMDLAVGEMILGDRRMFVGILRDARERKKTEHRIWYLAHHDALTELPNRILLEERVEAGIAEARRNGHGTAVMCVDIDRFKAISDSLGYRIGDKLLGEVAARLAGAVPDGGTLGRIGSDEFVITFTAPEARAVAAVVSRQLLETVSHHYTVDNFELHVTPSVGISLFPGDGDDAPTLMKHADIAMYNAKDVGRNSSMFYAPAMSASSVERLTMENSLHFAVERDELMLYYQPQVETGTGRLIGMEALVRWKHPDFGMVSPAMFIPIAEETGLIVSIGEWILNRACQDVMRLIEAGLPPLRVAVNVSARQFRHGNLLMALERTIAETGIDPRHLELELTESSIMQTADEAVAILQTFKELGVHLSIDDFGTGYSSLSYLKRFPIDKLKIDQSFIRHVVTDASDSAIVRSVIALGHMMRLRVIAEGVEGRDQAAFLEAQGCDEIQGYFYGVPMPFDDLVKYIHAKTAAAAV